MKLAHSLGPNAHSESLFEPNTSRRPLSGPIRLSGRLSRRTRAPKAGDCRRSEVIKKWFVCFQRFAIDAHFSLKIFSAFPTKFSHSFSASSPSSALAPFGFEQFAIEQFSVIRTICTICIEHRSVSPNDPPNDFLCLIA